MDKVNIEKHDVVLAGAMFFLAYIGVLWFNSFTNHLSYGCGVTIAVTLYGLAVMMYAMANKVKIGAGSVFWFVILIVTSLSYTFYYNASLLLFQSLYLRMLMIYFTADIMGALISGKTSGFIVLDVINMTCIIPLKNFGMQFMALTHSTKDKHAITNIWKPIVGLICGAPIIIMVAVLLSSADDNFGDMFIEITKFFGKDVWNYMWTAILSIPIGMYLYALIYGGAHKRYTDYYNEDKLKEDRKKVAVLPTSSVYIVLVAIIVMYIVFLSLQAGYYFSAMQGILPKGFTYSEYARRGFFELTTIAVINMGLIWVSSVMSRRKIKAVQVVLAIITMMLIITAIAKMYMYIMVYGLTPLRVIPTVFMIWLMLIFVLIVVDQFKPIPIVRIAVIAGAAGFAIMCMSDMDARIVRYDLNRYMEGTIHAYPDEVIYDSGIAGVPAMYEAWSQIDDEVIKDSLEYDIKQTAKYEDGDILYRDDSIGGINMAKISAREYLSRLEEKTD